MSYDSAASGALALAISTLLAVVTFFRWRSRGLASGLRGAAWTILPVAAWLTGVLELAFDIADSVGHWAVHVVFSPAVWLGIMLTGLSAVLFGAARVVSGRRRDIATTPPAALPTPKAQRRTSGTNDLFEDDLGDIEAILRKHGIS